MNSDGGKFYMKIVALDEIYNFVVQSFSIWSHLQTQIIDTLFSHDDCELRSVLFIDYLTMEMISNGKTLNYKIVVSSKVTIFI
jgi:hypothetical protein